MGQLTIKEAAARLGVSPGIKSKELNKIWRQLAKDNHPDLHPENEKKFKRLSEAYETLRAVNELTRSTSEIDETILDDDLKTLFKFLDPEQQRKILEELNIFDLESE